MNDVTFSNPADGGYVAAVIALLDFVAGRVERYTSPI